MNPIFRAAAPLAACLASALAAGAAHAQPAVMPLRIGQPATGQLVQSDEPVNDRGRFHAYRFDAAQGQRLLLTAESDDFDVYLIVGRQVGPVLDELRVDDDGGEDTDARLRFTAPRTGSYVALVQAYSEDELGAYTLSLAQAPDPTTGGTRPIAFGATEQGELALTDNEDEETARFYDQYSFPARTGQRIELDMQSETFDTYLRLGRMEGGEWQELVYDDDGGGDTNARIRYVIPADGEYLVRATSFGEDVGAYTLALRERPAPPPPVTRAIVPGTAVTSELNDDDSVLDADQSFYELWTYAGRAGERVRLQMDSDEFDTYLAIGRMVDGEFEEIATMDDGGEGTNTLLDLTLPDAGEYVIRANSFSAGETGEYTLRVEPLP